MFELIWILVCLFDGMAIGMLIAVLVLKLFGTHPMSKLGAVLFGLGGGIAYLCWLYHLSFADVGNWALLPIFGPVAISVVIWLYNALPGGKS